MKSLSSEIRVIAPLATLLDDVGCVDEASMVRQILSVRERAHALMPAIGCGEGIHLSTTQWKAILRIVVETSTECPIYMGVQAGDWGSIRDRVQLATDEGVDGVVIGLPPNDDSTHDSIRERLAKIRDEFPTNYILYWESFISRKVVPPTTMAEWCSVINAVGVKDSMRDPSATQRLSALVPKLLIYQGWEDLLGESAHMAGYIGPLALVSKSPMRSFNGTKDWVGCAREAKHLGLLDSNYVKNVKRLLREQSVAMTDLLVDEDIK